MVVAVWKNEGPNPNVLFYGFIFFFMFFFKIYLFIYFLLHCCYAPFVYFAGLWNANRTLNNGKSEVKRTN